MILTRKIGLILIPIILILLLAGILTMLFNSIAIIEDKSIGFILTDEGRNGDIRNQTRYLENLTQLNAWKAGFIIAGIVAPTVAIISISLIITPGFKFEKNKTYQL